MENQDSKKVEAKTFDIDEFDMDHLEQLLKNRQLHEARTMLSECNEVDLAEILSELEDEEQPIDLPPQIRILREVTADSRYTNAALSLKIPMEVIEKGNEI